MEIQKRLRKVEELIDKLMLENYEISQELIKLRKRLQELIKHIG